MTARTKSTKSEIVQQPVAQSTGLPTDYAEFLTNLKSEIRAARVRASLAVNRELVLLYWRMGKQILEKEAQGGWGAKVVEYLADDLQVEFPDMTGLSRRNLRYMKKLAAIYSDEQILQSLIAKLPWGHITRIMDGAGNEEERI